MILSPILATLIFESSFITLVLDVVIIDVCVSLLLSPLAIATFEIVPASSLTITENSTVVVPFASTSTNHLKDVTLPSVSVNVSTSPILDTYVVPSGIASLT